MFKTPYDWREFHSKASFEREYGFAYRGPGFYEPNGIDTMLVTENANLETPLCVCVWGESHFANQLKAEAAAVAGMLVFKSGIYT